MFTFLVTSLLIFINNREAFIYDRNNSIKKKIGYYLIITKFLYRNFNVFLFTISSGYQSHVFEFSRSRFLVPCSLHPVPFFTIPRPVDNRKLKKTSSDKVLYTNIHHIYQSDVPEIKTCTINRERCAG